MRELSTDRGDMFNLAYIAATIWNFELAWSADVCAAQTYTKIQNCGGNVGWVTHTGLTVVAFHKNTPIFFWMILSPLSEEN